MYGVSDLPPGANRDEYALAAESVNGAMLAGAVCTNGNALRSFDSTAGTEETPSRIKIAIPEHKSDDGPSHIVEIVDRLKTKYRVRWSNPPNTFSLILHSWLQKRYAGMHGGAV